MKETKLRMTYATGFGLMITVGATILLFQNCQPSQFEVMKEHSSSLESNPPSGAAPASASENETGNDTDNSANSNGAVTPKDCVLTAAAWSVEGNSCAAAGFVLSHGSSKTVTNASAGLSGSAVYRCNDADLTIVQKTCAKTQTTASTQPTPTPAPTPKPASPAPTPQPCVADSSSFPQRLTISQNGAVCGITLNDVVSQGALPPNNGAGASYSTSSLVTDKVPGSGRICLVCVNNKMQVSSNPDSDCVSAPSGQRQVCVPKTCQVDSNKAWGLCAAKNAARVLAWGESITLQNISSKASSGSITLTCSGQSGLNGVPQESDANCVATSNYSEIKSIDVERKYLGAANYMDYIMYIGNVTMEICSPYTSTATSPDCQRISIEPRFFDRVYPENRTYRAYTFHQGKPGATQGSSSTDPNGKMVSFWVNDFMVMVMDPWEKVTSNSRTSVIVQPGAYIPNQATVQSMSTAVLTSASNQESYKLIDVFPQLFMSQRAIDTIKADSRYRTLNLDLQGTIGRELYYDRDFTFKANDVPWK